ncbi:MAG: TlpA family protein disulfide reductase [Gemmatimonadaceae bacterium]|nr:TlpA family protein disulfide reductase [Gemmatimonadaceae bacterium]
MSTNVWNVRVPSLMYARLRAIVTAGCIAAATLGLASSAAAQEAGLPVGTKAPVLVLEGLDGSRLDLASVIGKKPVVLEFWATWCPLCRKLEPSLAAARAAFGGEVLFIGVGVPQNQTPERQAAYVAQQRMTGSYVFDRDGAAYKAFKATHTSYVVVIDALGVVVYTGVGAEQDIVAAVRQALPGARAGR